jgi:hypothetical protein
MQRELEKPGATLNWKYDYQTNGALSVLGNKKL